jgi:methyl-accepting chemotaxis protein
MIRKNTFGRLSFGIGAKVMFVAGLGIAGMLGVAVLLTIAISRVEDASKRMTTSHSVTERLAEFQHSINEGRIRFESFKQAQDVSSLGETETFVQIAREKLAVLEAQAATTDVAKNIRKLHALVQTVEQSISQVIPRAVREGPQSLGALRAKLFETSTRLEQLGQALALKDVEIADNAPGFIVAARVATMRNIELEAYRKPDSVVLIKMGGEVGEAQSILQKMNQKDANVADLKKTLDAYDTTFEIWLNAAASVRNDTEIAAGIFDILKPAIATLGAENSKQQLQAREEALRISEVTHHRAIFGVGAAFLLATICAFFAGRSITRPLQVIRNAMQDIAQGDASATIPYASDRHEIGSMARSVQVFQQAMQERQRLTSGQLEAARLQADRNESMTAAVRSFDTALLETQKNLSISSTELAAFSQALVSMSGNMDSYAKTALEAASGTANESTGVAAAANQLASSIAEISSQTEKANGAVRNAVSDSIETQQRMLSLNEKASAITSIVEVINTIAGQTNLLALNATIEAARAGEAGRGFAVVAQEIKALASQTSNATAGIIQQISAIQSATAEGAAAVGALAEKLGYVEESAVAVAAAVQEQEQSVSEIARIIANLSVNATLAQDASSRTFSETETAKAMANDLSRLAVVVDGVSTRFSDDAGAFLKTVNAGSGVRPVIQSENVNAFKPGAAGT